MKSKRALRTLFCIVVVSGLGLGIVSRTAQLKSASADQAGTLHIEHKAEAGFDGRAFKVSMDWAVIYGLIGNEDPGQTPAAPATQQSPTGEKTAEQTHKNIKVLVGLPDSQLIPVMTYFNASLGVECGFCHVGTGGRFDFEKDDKPEKAAARKMISMAMGINNDNFHGRHVISCFTCHRGKESPVGVPPLPLVAESGPREPGQSRDSLPTADQIAAKYIAALGGQAAIEKQKSRVMKGTQSQGNGPGAPVEFYQTAPDKFATIMKIQGGGEFTTVYDGSGAWSQNPRGQIQIMGDQLEVLKRSAVLNAPLRLAELYPKMRVAGTDKINDHNTYVVVSQLTPTLVVRMYFDSDSGLLLRTITLIDTMVGRIPQQIDYEDYRDVDGVKTPFVVKQTGIDGRSSFTRTFTEIKSNVPVEGSMFAAPKPKV